MIALVGVDGPNASIVVSASEDAVASGVHAGDLVKLAAPLVGGRGGGQAHQAQGGGKNPAGAQRALDAVRDAVLHGAAASA